MANIKYRASTTAPYHTSITAKAAALTNDEMDANLRALNDFKAEINSPTFTGTVSGITATMVGLGNVDNTTDANKPVSSATQTALNLKANLASPTFTGTVSGITATMVGAPSGSGTSSGTNTGDETITTIKTKLGITTLSGSNTGDQVLPTLGSLGGQSALVSGTNIKSMGDQSLLGSGEIFPTSTTTSIVSSGAISVNLSLAEIFRITLNGNATVTFTNPPASGIYKQVMIILTQDATGSRTCTFTNGKYTDAIAPVLSTAPNAVDVLSFFTVDAGTKYFGSMVMANVS